MGRRDVSGGRGMGRRNPLDVELNAETVTGDDLHSISWQVDSIRRNLLACNINASPFQLLFSNNDILKQQKG
jgi:hypothetical protein